MCIGKESWGVRIRKLNTSYDRSDLLELFITSGYDAKSFIMSQIQFIDNRANDIIILCDGKEIIRYDFQKMRMDTLQSGFYVYGDSENNENYINLYNEMRNMVEENCGKVREIMLFSKNFYTVNEKQFGPVYNSIIRKKNNAMMINENMYFKISNNLRNKGLFRKILNMNVVDTRNEIINSI